MSCDRWAALLALATCVACAGPDAVGPSSPSPGLEAAAREPAHPAKKYTLVLGHSLSFGLQPIQDPSDPANYKTGFSTLFVQRLNATRRHPHATEINLACPAETTETFIHGGCFYTKVFGLPLHRAYTGSQLDAAETFLRRHRGQVNPIILSLSANDLLLPFFVDCDSDEACIVARIPGAKEAVRANYELILSRLRRLEPHATLLILVEYRFPGLPRSFNDGVVQLYRLVRAAGRAHGAILVESNPIVQRNPCRMLFVCDPEFPDVHPTDAGYRAMARALWQASGFAPTQPAGDVSAGEWAAAADGEEVGAVRGGGHAVVEGAL
jgi:lysophospholipase L1-like esterase